MPTLFFLTGPTAVGKSTLALDWARRHGAEILYCDAFCVYKGMDIGTAKPDRAEQSLVPHHGLDLAEVSRTYTVADYAAMVKDVVEDCRRRDTPLLVSGGTGFYLKSFFAPVLDETKVPPEIVARVEALQKESGDGALLEELRKVAGGPVTGIDLENPRRVRKALERCLASGKPLAELQAAYRAMPEPFPGWDKPLVILTREKEDLDRRIEARAHAMIRAGLVDEVRRLLVEGLETNASAASAIGYREVIAHLKNGESGGTEALAGEIAAHTRLLVKKQKSFFRNQLPQGRVLNLTGNEAPGELFP
jgi:tRNA dimethylallyltransferase